MPVTDLERRIEMTQPSRPVGKEGISQPTRESMLRDQQRSFQELLRFAWERSPFYRDYYAGHGIKDQDLAHLTIRDLPFLSKQPLMEHFDAAVTDARLKRKDLEQWIEDNPAPGENYRKEFIVIHSSGSSGNTGIFVYDQIAWRIANSTIGSRLPLPENYPSGKTRVAFFRVTHGHFGGVSTAMRMPIAIFDTLILSLLDPIEQVVERLNAFQPHRLDGYSSSISMLAELALQGKLRIGPQNVFVSGDKLTANIEETIRRAWRAPIYNLYNAVESKYLAFKGPSHDEMMVMDDLNLLEVLDENNRPVSAGEEGRVVLTNLYNRALPILRYELGDYVTLGRVPHDLPFTTIGEIRGRVYDALPIVRSDGRSDTIHPLVMASFHAPGLEKVQFISRRPDLVQIDYVAGENIDAMIQKEFQRILNLKGASRTTFEPRRVQHIPNDSQTGKLRLVKIEHDQKH
jgi:phenylacetate-coenzyme A ligase PaaK-like adenylate-forming protein